MGDKSLNISTKTITLIGISVLLIVFAIVILNSYNYKRKYSQFQELNKIVVNSDYLQRFNSLRKNFSAKDTLQIKSIKENLGLLVRDYDEIDYSKIIIKNDSLYHTISSFQYYNKNSLMDSSFFLPKGDSEFIQFIDSTEAFDLKEMFLLSKDKTNNELMMKINTHSYLFVRQGR